MSNGSGKDKGCGKFFDLFDLLFQKVFSDF